MFINMQQAFFRRFVCLMMVILFLAPVCTKSESPATDELPNLHINVYTIYAYQNGEIIFDVTVGWSSGSGKNQIDSPEDIHVTAFGENGLNFEYFSDETPDHPFSESYDIQKMEIATSFYIHCKYTDPENAKHPLPVRPKITIHVTSSNCGGIIYSAELDVQPQARVALFYRTDVEFGDCINATAMALKKAYEYKKYDGKEVFFLDNKPNFKDSFGDDGFNLLKTLNLNYSR